MFSARTIAAGVCFGVVALSCAANPYAPIRTINGDVITDYDIEQRANLLDALGAEGDLEALALEQLIDDRLKIQSGNALGFILPEGAVFAGLEEFAATRGMSLDQVLTILEAREIDRQAMDDYVEAGLVWREVVGVRFRDLSLPSDTDVDAAMANRARETVDVYQLAEIALPYSERGRVETSRLADELYRELSLGGNFAQTAQQFSRADSAPQGGQVEDMSFDQIPPPLQTALQGLSPGDVTQPIEIAGGVAIIKLIAIRQEVPEPNPEVTEFETREAVRRELFAERIDAFGDGYLQELRADAVITE
ncbi:MAG: peptidylprolyl isomerase [Pseudomonadota bacterium]